jgi:uncharacterized protein (TIGR02453 family)
MASPTARVGEFRGFPADALDFFAELEANNDRSWWLANKERFDESVRDPLRALLDVLEPAFGTFRVFRMNRDVRFSKDKSPYKTAHAAMAETEGGSLHYVQISGSGLLTGAGIYHAMPDQVARWRAAVADDHRGPAVEQVIAAVRRAGLDVIPGADPPLATAPRGVDRQHPRIELLRWKGCSAMKDFGAPAWLHTRRAAERVAGAWADAAPLVTWLDANVGASEMPPGR